VSTRIHGNVFTVFFFMFVMSVIRPQETRYGPCQCSSCKK
jgi:hypothetical protein